jgi:ArsR family transcriptional regulator
MLMNPNGFADKAKEASEMLGALAHSTRLNILWMLCDGDRSVTQLERSLALRQPTVSQQLARLRRAGLVHTRREGKMIYYRLAGPHVRSIVDAVAELFSDAAPARPNGNGVHHEIRQA